MKTAIDRKAIKSIIKRVESGEDKQSILDELQDVYFDQKHLATILASIPDPERKSKFQIFNQLILVLLGISILMKVVMGVFITASVSVFLTPFGLFVPVLTIFFFYQVKNNRAHAYLILTYACTSGILKLIQSSESLNGYFLADLVLIVLILICTVTVKQKMFPNWGWLGPKKDSDGAVIIN